MGNDNELLNSGDLRATSHCAAFYKARDLRVDHFTSHHGESNIALVIERY